MGIISLAQLGRVEKEVVINKDLKLKLHTLSVTEMQKALAGIPNDIENEVAKFTHMQQAVLIQATDSVNDQGITKDEAKELYANLQHNIFAEIFVEYTALAGEQAKVLEDLKKK
jgi:hypothetical protein